MKALLRYCAGYQPASHIRIQLRQRQSQPRRSRGHGEKAVSLIKSEGKEKAFAAISDPANTTFHDRDLYIYVYDMNGVAVAHGNNPKMVGKPLIGMKDNEGKLMIKEMVDLAKSKGKGWVDFKWPNPVTKSVESKSGYIEKVDDVLVGSGVYK
jgi:signal transduction histidine kinase